MSHPRKNAFVARGIGPMRLRIGCPKAGFTSSRHAHAIKGIFSTCRSGVTGLSRCFSMPSRSQVGNWRRGRFCRITTTLWLTVRRVVRRRCERSFRSVTAYLATKRLNLEDGTPGRTRLWQNYRETHLTYPQSYLARLNYVHQNPRHHELVPLASQWKWCSAAAFKREATPAWVKTIAGFPFDEIAAEDGE